MAAEQPSAEELLAYRQAKKVQEEENWIAEKAVRDVASKKQACHVLAEALDRQFKSRHEKAVMDMLEAWLRSARMRFLYFWPCHVQCTVHFLGVD